LTALQGADGSFTNPADRWMEGDPVLATAYALLALNLCIADME
jgi:squalene-hopene/tetraprenyl-beta-curcumene cyclase